MYEKGCMTVRGLELEPAPFRPGAERLSPNPRTAIGAPPPRGAERVLERRAWSRPYWAPGGGLLAKLDGSL